MQGAEQVGQAVNHLIEAGRGTATQARTVNVIPSRPAVETRTITVMDERYLGEIARPLGVTVDVLLAENQLAEGAVKPGQVIKVRTTGDLIDQFEQRREARRIAKDQAMFAKQQAKSKAEAAGRAVKKLRQRIARMNKIGKTKDLATLQAQVDALEGDIDAYKHPKKAAKVAQELAKATQDAARSAQKGAKSTAAAAKGPASSVSAKSTAPQAIGGKEISARGRSSANVGKGAVPAAPDPVAAQAPRKVELRAGFAPAEVVTVGTKTP